MISRFKYSYTLRDVWEGIISLFRKEEVAPQLLDELFPASHTYLISSARLGIKYALEAFKLKKGAKVGVQPYTCSSVLAAIVSAELIPFFIDIDETLTLDCNDLSAKIDQIDALIVTHTFGFTANILKIKSIASHLPILEDCAHALFSRYSNQQVGAFFDASVFSFGNGKFPSLGGGGMLVITNKSLNEYVSNKLAELPKPNVLNELTHIVMSYGKALLNTRIVQYAMTFFLSEDYLNKRNKEVITDPIKEFQLYRSTKRLLKFKLPSYQDRSEKQFKNGLYLSMMIKEAFPFLTHRRNRVNYFAFVLFTKDRDKLYRYLKSKKIGSGKHFQHSLSWALAYGYKLGNCPSFELYNEQLLTISCNYSLRPSDLDRIVSYLLEYRQKELQ